MSKKLTFGKLLGIIFCILAAAGTIVLLWANAYFSGQMKLIDKLYTAVERDDFEGYKACWAYPEACTEEEFSEAKKEILILQDNEKVHVKAKLTAREQFYLKGQYALYYDLTVYNDEEHKETQSSALVIRYGGKWLIG